jgi:hypothetical protein
MKTIISRTMLLIAALAIVGSTQAAEPVRASAPSTKRTAMERTLDRALSRHLTFPITERTNMLGEVYVSFVIDKEGRLEVLECNSSNERLKQHVLRKLAKIDIGDNPEGVWRTTHMRIVFRPEHTQG